MTQCHREPQLRYEGLASRYLLGYNQLEVYAAWYDAERWCSIHAQQGCTPWKWVIVPVAKLIPNPSNLKAAASAAELQNSRNLI